MKKILLSAEMLLTLFLFNAKISGQGVTTGSMNGIITSDAGETLPGCIVLATHKPSGSQYATTTGANGNYYIPNLKVGGPYVIRVVLLGYQEQKDSSVYIELGEELNLNFKLEQNNIKLQEIVISSKPDNTFNSGRTGAITNISVPLIKMLPSVSRSLDDYMRITPQANNNAGGLSYAGANNRYNNFSVDGSVNNDVFGLSSSGTNGGMAGTQPISLDAIQAINVAISPYDVKQGGFTGAGINAVTKSGTNSFVGDVYYFINNQNFVGKTPTDDPTVTRTKLSNYSSMQTGFSSGGPIIKDKLFFFLNAELTDRSDPSKYNIGQGSNIPDSIAQNIYNHLKEITGGKYDGGGFAPFVNKTKSYKLFSRVDWNINTNNKLTIRNNYVQASEDNLGRSINSLVFDDGGYTMKSNTNNTVMELDSRFSNQLSNELRIGYTTVGDNRVPMGPAFPSVTVENINHNPSLSVSFGNEKSSMANSLYQHITTLSDNLTIYLNKHKVTIGTEDELFHFKNLFIQDNYGYYVYGSTSANGYNAFMDVGSGHELSNWDCTNYTYYYSTVSGQPRWAPQFNAMQYGLYVQDEFNIVKNLKITAGIRADVPVFPDNPTENNAFNTDINFTKYGVATNQMPKSNPLYSPRLGFNWNVNGKHNTQVRGGTGIFTGRIPFVWLSNQFSNTGIEIARLVDNSKPVVFNSDPYNQPGPLQLGLSAATTEVDVVAKNFKFAQNFRTNFAIDQKLPFGIKATIEGIYTKIINDIAYQDLNLAPTTNLQGIDNRPIYPIAPNNLLESNKYTHVMYLTNTNKGYSYTLTAKLEKEFQFGLQLLGAYTYGQAYSINDGSASVALSNWQNNYQYQSTNNPEMSYSKYALKSRIIGVVTYKVKYTKHCTTTFGLFYNGQSGEPYSYCYYGDINNDGNKYNDLIYVPQSQSEIKLVTSPTGVSPDTQWAELDQFIKNDKYLSTQRGKYAERNGARTPFENHLDFRIAQEFYINASGKKNTLEVSFDILNFTNLINSKWGRSYYVSYNQDNLVTFNGFSSGTTPTFYYTPSASKPWLISDLASRWRAQIGLRYSFD
jgi:hypothetical protein